MSATLSIVGTPIGNLEDITLRALRVLKEADLVLCEDTRVTRKLLDRYDIGTKTLSYHQHSSVTRVDEILGLLKEGKKIALVTDAGMPGISDPGPGLVNYVRALPEVEVAVEVVPGPSALVAAVALSGMVLEQFLYLGFLPHKKGRQTALREIAISKRAVVLYESSHRIDKLLGELATHCPQRKVMILKELTKMHEEMIEGTPNELTAILEANPEKKKGEFVVLVTP